MFEPLSVQRDSVTLTFVDHSKVSYVIAANKPQVADWGFRTSEATLTMILNRTGYSQLNADEIAEILKVIGGAFAGPKAVTLDGQSTHLKVVSVQLDR